jgi:hypothetical protein
MDDGKALKSFLATLSREEQRDYPDISEVFDEEQASDEKEDLYEGYREDISDE